MKQYAVDIDIVMSKRIHVDADSEEQARALAEKKMADPYYYTTAGVYVSHEITDINEEDQP